MQRPCWRPWASGESVLLRPRRWGPCLQSTLLPLIYPGVFYILLFDLTYAAVGMELTLLFVLLFLVPSMNDCFALFTGMACGKRKLSPQISPKKTVEGSVGGLGRGGDIRRGVALPGGAPCMARMGENSRRYGITPCLAFWRARFHRLAIWPRRW